ncbi:hypothetical protein [Nitratireductor sp. XY-223]|uniref:hypothetical protein n=1 Tax=Nitratireductor sp. XY-223 TaxID=2561926 RepID=UPI0010AAB8EC|nr:hypothetical protein [Nitratireductor sp. XY-223]
MALLAVLLLAGAAHAAGRAFVRLAGAATRRALLALALASFGAPAAAQEGDPLAPVSQRPAAAPILPPAPGDDPLSGPAPETAASPPAPYFSSSADDLLKRAWASVVDETALETFAVEEEVLRLRGERQALINRILRQERELTKLLEPLGPPQPPPPVETPAPSRTVSAGATAVPPAAADDGAGDGAEKDPGNAANGALSSAFGDAI